MICYHGTPLAGDECTAAAVLRGRDCMVSFEHPKQIEIAMEVCRTVALDNGAFSAWKRGRPTMDWSGYYEWVRHWHQHPAFAFAVIPDVIDGTEKDNDRLIDEWPLSLSRGVPVWHMHESTERLRRLIWGFSTVAIGSSGEFAQTATPRWWQRMGEAMRIACDDQGRPRARLHGLRMLDPTILAHLPLASADSTNAARNMGLDSKWGGPYEPPSKAGRAVVIMDRIEAHATAKRWRGSAGLQLNFEVLDYAGEEVA